MGLSQLVRQVDVRPTQDRRQSWLPGGSWGVRRQPAVGSLAGPPKSVKNSVLQKCMFLAFLGFRTIKNDQSAPILTKKSKKCFRSPFFPQAYPQPVRIFGGPKMHLIMYCLVYPPGVKNDPQGPKKVGSGGSKTRFLGVWTPKKWPFWLKNVTFWGFWGSGGLQTPKIDKNVNFFMFLALFEHLEAPKMVIFQVLGVWGVPPIGCCTFRQVCHRPGWLGVNSGAYDESGCTDCRSLADE